jgi:Skp family chaperone for outer membrane proteins
MAFSIPAHRRGIERRQGCQRQGKSSPEEKRRAAGEDEVLESNKQKLQQGGAVLNEAARAQTQKEIDRLTVEIDRFQEDANAEVQELQQQLQGEFQEKLRPIVDAMVKELAIGLLFSSSDAGAIYVDPSLDITPEVIKRFDAAGGVAKPAAAAPAPSPAKPAAPSTAKPAAPAPTTPPKPVPAKP